MRTIHVSLSPVGDFCHVRVDGRENAQWLLRRLSQSFVFKTIEPFDETVGSSDCSFQVAYDPPLSPQSLERLLSRMPEVQLRKQPA